MTPRTHVVPMGVEQAESRSNVEILVSFTAPSAELGLVMKAAKIFEDDGQPVALEWLRNERGIIEGIAIRGERRVA